MKKILIIIPTLKFGGGAEKVASVVGSKLKEKGYMVSFFTFYDDKEKYPFFGNYFSLHENLKNNILIKFIKLFSRAYKIKKYCKKNGIESCISFMEDANFSAILSKVLFKNNSKINISIHHSIIDYGKGIYYYLIKILYKFADKIIVLTNHEKENLIKNFKIKEDKIKIIYNSIDIEKINNLKNEDLGEYNNLFKNGKFTFINIGRLNKIKNQKLLIDTFIDFNKKYNTSQLIILGDGELRKDLEDLIGNNNDIYLLGNQKNVYKFLSNSHCFILTSFSESFSNVIIEAMACNLPILSSSTQGAIEIIGRKNNYGIIFENNNKKSLFKAMEKIYLDENLRINYQKKSLERSKDFEINEIIKEWEKILII